MDNPFTKLAAARYNALAAETCTICNQPRTNHLLYIILAGLLPQLSDVADTKKAAIDENIHREAVRYFEEELVRRVQLEPLISWINAKATVVSHNATQKTTTWKLPAFQWTQNDYTETSEPADVLLAWAAVMLNK